MNPRFSAFSCTVCESKMNRKRIAASVTCLAIGTCCLGAELQGLSFDPNYVYGMGMTVGRISLTSVAPEGGVTRSLSSSSGVLYFPATVTVVQGTTSADFELSAGHVSQTYVRSVTASYNGINKVALVTIHPGLRHVALSPEEVTGGSPTQGNVSLWGPAPPGGVDMSLSDNSASVLLPTSVHVPEGSSIGLFSASTSQVSADATRLVFANLNGVTKANYVRLTAGPRIASFTISPSTVQGGSSTTGTVTFTGPIPSSTRTIQITDNSSAVTPPFSQALVSGGATDYRFAIATSGVSATYTRKVSVSMGGTLRTANITLTP